MSWEKQIGFFMGIAGFAIGNVSAYLLHADVATAVTAVLCACVCLTLYFWRTQMICMIGVFACLWFAVGVIRVDMTRDVYREQQIADNAGQTVTLTGIVTEELDIREFNMRATVDVSDLDTRILLTLPLYPRYSYGDTILITGTLNLPENFVGDTGRYFDYANYLRKDGIDYIMRYPQTQLVGRDGGNTIKRILLDIKSSFIGQLQTILPEPHVSLLGGLLLGAKSSLGAQLLDDFRTTGVIHIVVLSGFNITIIVAFIMMILGYLGIIISSIIGSIAILFFAIMTGAGSTIVRASLMAFLVIIARITGNHSAVIRMLFLAGFIMICINPMLLLYDPSFQLSFMATIGLIMVSPPVARMMWFIPNPSVAPLRELMSATFATQIMVMPLLLYMMGTMPTYAPFANFLILATVPYVMLVGFIAGLLSYVSVAMALPITMVTYLLLDYDLRVVDLFANLPWASFAVPPFSFVWVVIVYILYGIIGWYAYRHEISHGLQAITNNTTQESIRPF